MSKGLHKTGLMVINFKLLLRFLVGGMHGLNASGLGKTVEE